MDPKTEYLNQAVRYFDKLGRLNLWTGIQGAQRMQFENESHRKNREAEEGHARKTVWGYSDEGSGDSDVGNTILGDINQPPPVVYPPQQSNNLAAAMMPLGLVAAGALGYWISQNQTQPQPSTDETVQIGLGKIEDYFPNPKE